MTLAGTGIKSLTILLVAAIVVMAGFRPVMRTLLSSGAAIEGPAVAALESPLASITGSGAAPIDMPEMASPLLEPGANPFEPEGGLGSGFGSGLSFGRSLALGPVEKLGAIIDSDEEQATAIMKHWVKNG
jgi:flagellar M-ring protein FliF